jgi:hypothetical protein
MAFQGVILHRAARFPDAGEPAGAAAGLVRTVTGPTPGKATEQGKGSDVRHGRRFRPRSRNRADEDTRITWERAGGTTTALRSRTAGLPSLVNVHATTRR